MSKKVNVNKNEKAIISDLDFTIDGIEAISVDSVNAAAVEMPDKGIVRNIIAGNRESFTIQAVDFIYREKAVYRSGNAEAAMADSAWVKGADDRTHFVGFAKQYPMRVEESELFRMGAFKVQPNGSVYVSEKTGISRASVKNFSDEIVLMNFQAAETEKVNLLNKVLDIETVLKIEANGVCRWYAKGIFGNKDLWYDIRFCTSGDIVNKGLRLGKLLNMKGAKISIYTSFAASASMQRSYGLYLVKANREEMVAAAKAVQEAAKAKATQEEIDHILEEGLKTSYEAAMGKATAIINSLSGGVYKRYLTSMEGKEVSLEKRNKTASRFTLPFTNSNSFGKVSKIAIANFEIKEADGHGLFNAEFLFGMFKELFPDAKVAKDMFVGYWMQARLEASVKGGHTPIPAELLKLAILNLAKRRGAEIVYLGNKNLTDAFYKYVDGNGSAIMKKRYDGKILVYGTKNLEEVEFFGDLNVFKTFPELGHEMQLALMATAAPISKTVNTSNQVIAKLLRVPEALPVLKKLMQDAIDKKWEMEAKECFNSFEAFMNVEYGVDSMLKLNPEFVLADANLTKNVVEACAKSSINMVSNLNIPVEGFSAYMIPDYAMVYFGVKVIKDDEMFVTDTKYIGKRAQLVRHPSSSAGEHVGLTAIGINTVAARLFAYVKAGMLSIREYMLLKQLYASLTGNVVVLPVNDVLVNKLGGADWDGDIVSIIFEAFLVALLDMVPEEAIDYGSIAASGQIVIVNNRMIVDAYNAYVKNGNRPIGMVVNFILAMMGTLAAIENGKFKDNDIKSLLRYIKYSEYRKAYGNDGDILANGAEAFNPEAVLCFDNDGEYERQFVGDNLFIDAKCREEFAEYVYRVGLNSPENFKLFLEDAIKAYSGIANDTIDAAKKGGKVDCWFYNLSDYIKGGLIQTVSVGYNEEGTLEIDAPFFGLQSHPTMKYVSEDIGAELKKFGIGVVRDKIETTLAKAEELQVASEDIREDDVYDGIDFFAPDKKALKALASTNNKLNSGAPSIYKEVKEYVLAFARYLAKAATSSIEERYELFKEASVMKDGTYSGFYTKFGPEMITMAMGEKDYILRSRLYSLAGDIIVEDGDEIKLVNGKAANGVFTVDKLTGIFDIEIINGEAYATKSAKEYLKGFMDDDKFVVELNAFEHLKDKVDLSGKNGINTTIAAANSLLKKEVDDLLAKMNSKEYSFKFMKYNGGLVLVPIKNAQGTKFPISVLVAGKLGEGNAFIEALAGKEVFLDNVIQFNYYKEGTVRGKSIPQFVVALTGSIK